MAEFESCDKCKYNEKSETEYPCNQCVHNATDKFKPMTHADKIRSMSDEELAYYIFGVSVGSAPCVKCSDDCDLCELSDEDCKKKTLEWLQSEAE